MTYSSQMALKPYLEKITSLCEKLSQKEMLALILSLARDVSSAGRAAFLTKIESFLPDAAVEEEIPQDEVDDLIDQIAELEEEISDRIESIEDGSYWEDADEWEGGYDNEEPDDLTEAADAGGHRRQSGRNGKSGVFSAQLVRLSIRTGNIP